MMQRWEYMTWVVSSADLSDDSMRAWEGGRVKYIDSHLIADWRDGSRIAVKLAQAGEDGWELVSVNYAPIATSSITDALYIFKRPLSGNLEQCAEYVSRWAGAHPGAARYPAPGGCPAAAGAGKVT